MALLRNNLSLKMKGRAGAYTFYSSKGRQVARVSQNSSNYGESARRSLAQQTRRVKWANLVNFYKATNKILHGAFETKRANETDYNAFMRKNLSMASVALTKDMAAKGCFVPQLWILTEGSLPTPAYGWQDAAERQEFYTGLETTLTGEISSKTIAAFSENILESNPTLKEGMQITFVWAHCTIREGEPFSSVKYCEITLSKTDTRLISAVAKGAHLYANEDGELVIDNITDEAYMAVIISDSTSGGLKVSSSSLVAGDTEPEEQFSADDAVAAAVESYGLDPDRFLDSGDFQG